MVNGPLILALRRSKPFSGLGFWPVDKVLAFAVTALSYGPATLRIIEETDEKDADDV
jgi:hypothetical protein